MAAAPPVADPLGDALVAHARSLQSPTAAPVAPAPSSNDPLGDALVAHARTLQPQQPASPAPPSIPPPAAPGAPPSLPPVSKDMVQATPQMMPPGAKPGAQAAPLTPPPAPPATAPKAPVLSTLGPPAARQVYEAPGARPTIPQRGKPLSYQALPEEEALHASDRALDTLPAFAHAPGFHPAEGGPIERLRENQRLATVRLAQRLPGLRQAWQQDYQQLQQEENALSAYRKNLSGDIFSAGVTSPEAKVFNAREADLRARAAKLKARGDQIDAYTKRVLPVLQRYESTPLHSGLLYPEETKQAPPGIGQEFAGALGQTAPGRAVHGFMQGFVPHLAATPQLVNRARAHLMLTGEYPQLPDPPSPIPRPAAIKMKNDVLNALTMLGSELTDQGTLRRLRPNEPPQPGMLGQPTQFISPGQARQMVPKFNSWQRELIPVIRKQLLAEGKAASMAGVPGAIAKDAATFTVAALSGGLAGEALGPLASRLVQPLEERLVGQGAGAIAGRLALHLAPRLVAGAGGGAAAGSAAGFTSAALSGAKPGQILAETGRGALGGAAVGSLFAGIHAAPDVWRVSRQALGSGWDPNTSPSQVAQLTQAAQRVYGLTATEAEGLERRLTRIGKAPQPVKNRMMTALKETLEAAHTPKVSAAPEAPPPATRTTATPTVPNEPRITTADGTSISLRHTTPEALEQIARDAEAKGDGQTAQRARGWLSLHEAHQAHQHPDIPLDLHAHFTDEMHKPGSKPMAVHRQMTNAAKRFETEDPDLAAKLKGSAAAAMADFQRQYYQDNLDSPKEPLPKAQGHPQAAPWRRLTEEQKAKLPASVKESLIVQDISNSLQVEDPGHPGVHRLSEVPGRPRTAAAAERIADAEFARAQETMAQRHPAPEAPTIPAPAPMPTEVPTAPVQSAEAQSAPTAPPPPETAPEPATAAPAEQPKAKGGVTQFGREWGGAPAAEKAAPAEPKLAHEMTQPEFLKATEGQLTSATGVQKAPVAEKGKPGIRIEASTTKNPELGERVVVFRDAKGEAQGTLHFTAPGEAMGVNKRASVLGVYVEPGSRGQGIGTRLYDALEDAGYTLPPWPEWVFTREGAQLYHSREVRKALERGDTVPDNVLSDYPKLKQQIAEGRYPGGTIDAETGLGNKAAWDSTVRGKAVAVVRAAHPEADTGALTAAVADALKKSGLEASVYHVGEGDFRVTADDPAALEKALAHAKEYLAQASVGDIEGPHPQGVELSYGIGPTESAAEQRVGVQPTERGAAAAPEAEARPAGAGGGKPGGAAGAGGEPTAAGGGGRERAAGEPAGERPARAAAGGERQPGSEARAAGKAGAEAAEKPGAVAEKPVPPGFRPGHFLPGASSVERAEAAKAVEGLETGSSGQPSLKGDSPFDLWVENNYGAVMPERQQRGLGAGITRLKQMFSRAFAPLPEKGRYGVIREQLLQRLSARHDAAVEAAENTYAMVHDLSEAEHLALTKIYAANGTWEDLGRWRKAWEEAGNDPKDFDPQPLLPEGLTEQDVFEAAAAARVALKRNPKLAAVVERIRAERAPLLKRLLDAHESVFGTRPQFDREWYMHHQIVSYQNGALLGGEGTGGTPGRIGATPGMMKARTGSEMAWNAHFVESEVAWQTAAIRRSLELETVRHIHDEHDITAAVKIAQAELNAPEHAQALNQAARGGPVGAALVDHLGTLAAKGMLPDRLDGAFEAVIDGMHEHLLRNRERQGNGQGIFLPSPELEAGVRDYAKFLTETLRKGTKIPGKRAPDTHVVWDMGRLAFFGQGMSVPERMALAAAAKASGLALRPQLSPEAAAALPGGSNLPVRVDEGGVPAVPDRITQRAEAKLKRLQAQRTMIIPKELAQTLKEQGFGQPDTAEHWLLQTLRGAQNLWKIDLLYGPVHGAAFLSKKMVLDQMAMLRFAPKVYGQVATGEGGKVLLSALETVAGAPSEPAAAHSALLKAARDVVKQYFGAVPDKDMRKFDAMGGEAGGMLSQEGLGLGYRPLRRFDQGKSLPPEGRLANFLWRQAGRLPQPVREAAGTLGKLARLPVAGLEKTARYGVYRYYLDHYREHGVFPNMGVSKPEQVNALVAAGKPEEAAFKLSDDIVGAYRARTEGTRWLRKYVVPFASIKEILISRNVQGMKNAWNDPDIAIATGRKLIGEQIGAPKAAQIGATRAWAVGRFALGAAFSLYGLSAVNHLLFPEEEKKLRKLLGGRPYLITGHADPKTGEIPYHTDLSELGETLNFTMGYNNWGQIQSDLMSGRKNLGQAIWEVTGHNAWDQIMAGVAPQYKLLGETEGLRYGPEGVSAARDPKETLFNEVGLGDAYRRSRQEPIRRGFWMKTLTGSQVGDPQEMTYWKAKDDRRAWEQRTGKPDKGITVGQGSDPARDAAYWHKMALRLGDRDGADYWLWQFANAAMQGATAKGGPEQLDKKLQQSYLKLDPLTGMKANEVDGYLKSLNRDEQGRLRAAYQYYQHLVAPEMDMAPYQRLSLRQFVREMHGAVVGGKRVPGQIERAVKQQFPIERGQSMSPMLAAYQSAKDKPRYLASLNGPESLKFREAYHRFQERAAPNAPVGDWDKLPLAEFARRMERTIQVTRKQELRRSERQTAKEAEPATAP